MSLASNHLFKISSQSKTAWVAIIAFIAFLLLCFIAGKGTVLILLFPLSAFALSLFLYFHYPSLYVGFTLWIWFLAPLIRRIIDYQSGFQTPGPSTAASFLVTIPTFITLAKELPRQYKKTLPVFICLGAVFYSFVIGIVQNPLDKVLVYTLWWSCPISFGFYLLINWQNYFQFRQVIQQAFFWAIIAMGLYGVWQFCTAPSWDVFWLNGTEADSFGSPLPFQIRVFSTLNAPQTFGKVMSVGLLTLFGRKMGILGYIAMIFGYLTLLLSQARAAWLGWMTGLLVLVFSIKLRHQIKIILSIAIALIVLIPLISVLPWAETITSRIDSLSSLESDTSLNARLEGYNDLLSTALSQVRGKGLGYTVEGNGIGANDGSILTAFFSLGWLGVIPYFIGFSMLLLKLYDQQINRQNFFNYLDYAIIASILIQVGLNFIFVGMNGILLWTFICLRIASKKYYSHQQKILEYEANVCKI